MSNKAKGRPRKVPDPHPVDQFIIVDLEKKRAHEFGIDSRIAQQIRDRSLGLEFGDFGGHVRYCMVGEYQRHTSQVRG